MTREEAIRILDPEFVANEFAKYDEEHGIRDVEHLKAIYDSCVLAVAALREQEDRRWIPVTERLPSLENALRAVQAENKQLHQQLEAMKQDRDYYRDAYYHLLKEQRNVKDD